MAVAVIDEASVRVDDTGAECVGPWTSLRLREVEKKLAELRAPHGGSFRFDLRAVTAMDTTGAWLLYRSQLRLTEQGAQITLQGSSDSARAMLELVSKHAPGERPRTAKPGALHGLGHATVAHIQQSMGYTAFVGELACAAGAVILKPARIRWRVILNNLQAAGVAALPIVGLLSFLLGIVIGYQGGVPLEDYGASLFVADLVGLAMVRELAPLITAIIVAGRTGSAYTAQIGTMKVTEEIDALRTIGIVPMEVLVLPKVLALAIALPLLTVYADILGILGGMMMAWLALDISFAAFIDRLAYAVDIQSFLIGIGKAPVFALIIATVGCYQGFRVAGSAESVGRQTTKSVVQSIFLVLVVDATVSVIFSVMGI
ncbi:MAG: MlaE family lipid ABC transporter permease subunit [Gammaproteobacteria bacterium]|nr:MlaE family lipid ABC transporter permease subunit [Gammaproteobacteria bacterium]